MSKKLLSDIENFHVDNIDITHTHTHTHTHTVQTASKAIKCQSFQYEYVLSDLLNFWCNLPEASAVYFCMGHLVNAQGKKPAFIKINSMSESMHVIYQQYHQAEALS